MSTDVFKSKPADICRKKKVWWNSRTRHMLLNCNSLVLFM